MADITPTQELPQTKGISIERLQTLCRVVEAGGASKACAMHALDMGQVSRQLKELEVYFGQPLFTGKSKKGFQLSEFGKQAYWLASGFINELFKLRQASQNMAEKCIIAAGVGLIPWLILPRIEALRSIAPHLNFELVKRRSQQIVEGVLSNQIDFGLVRLSAIEDDRIGFRMIGRVPFALFLSNVTARKFQVAQTENPEEVLLKVPLVLINGDGEFRQRFEAHSKARKWNLKPVLECESFVDAASVIANGPFCTILPQIATNQLTDQKYLCISCSGFNLTRDIGLVWNATRSKNLTSDGKRFIKELESLLTLRRATWV